MDALERAKNILLEGYTCVLVKEDEIITSNARGVAPIVELYRSGRKLNGFSVADKIVGKAVAMLLALVGAKEVYADTMSASALPVLEGYGIAYSYGELTERIINREGTDVCPMEKAVASAEDPETAYAEICATLERLRKNK